MEQSPDGGVRNKDRLRCAWAFLVIDHSSVAVSTGLMSWMKHIGEVFGEHCLDDFCGLYKDNWLCDHTAHDSWAVCVGCCKKKMILANLVWWVTMPATAETIRKHEVLVRKMSGKIKKQTLYRGLCFGYKDEAPQWKRFEDGTYLYEGRSHGRHKRPIESWTPHLRTAGMYIGPHCTAVRWIVECQIEDDDDDVIFDTNSPSPYEHGYLLDQYKEVILKTKPRRVRLYDMNNLEACKSISPELYEYVVSGIAGDIWGTGNSKRTWLTSVDPECFANRFYKWFGQQKPKDMTLFRWAKIAASRTWRDVDRKYRQIESMEQTMSEKRKQRKRLRVLVCVCLGYAFQGWVVSHHTIINVGFQ